MNKKEFMIEIIIWMIVTILVFWLVEGSIWLKIFLAISLISISSLSSKLRYNRLLFDIADAELVRVSKLADELSSDVQEIKEKLEDMNKQTF